MQRIAKILAALVCASGILGADMAWAHGPGGWGGGGWHGGWGGGGGWYGGWGGWGYPYYGYGYPYDYGYGYPYGYGYGNGYPPPEQPSPYCATRTRICTLGQPREVGSSCTCRGARGVISGGPPPQ
jgi:hypothetical protein